MPTTTSTITAERTRTAYLCSFPVMIARGNVCTNCHRVVPKSKGMSPLPTDNPESWHERYCLDCGGDPKTNGRTTKEGSRREKLENRAARRTNATPQNEPNTEASILGQDAPTAGQGTPDNDQRMFAFT